MSEDIFSKKENAFDALLEEFGVTEGVEAPPTTNDFSDLFGTEPPKTTEPTTEATAEPKKAPNFDDLLADMPTKTEESPKSNDLLADAPTKAEETPSLFDDLLADAKPAKPKKKEPEHIPDKSEDYRVPNDVLHLNKVPKPDNSWEAEAADIVVPEVKPKDTKGANPFGNTAKGATPGATKGANPFGNATSAKGATPGATPGANPFGATKGANPFGNATPSKSANPTTPTKGANPFGTATPAKTSDNFNPFIKQEPAKEALWTSPGDLDYDQLAEKIVEKLIQKIAQKLK